MKEKKSAIKHNIKKPLKGEVSAKGRSLPVRQADASDGKKSEKRIVSLEAKEAVMASRVSLSNLRRPVGAHKKRKYLGRGSSSGHGKTSTRGSKGQTSRAGRHFYLGFEGGQSPLIRKFPKRGFVSNFKKIYQIINLSSLNSVKETTITPLVLKAHGLIGNEFALIKILGNGSLKNAVTIQAHAFSKRAAEGILSAGGKAEVINV